MFGSDFLIAATYPDPTKVEVYLPKDDNWYDFYNGKLMDDTNDKHVLSVDIDKIGIFVKAGSIIPRKYMKRLSALQTLRDPFLLEIYPTVLSNTATGNLYLDDGLTTSTVSSSLIFEYLADNSLELHIAHFEYNEQPMVIDSVNIYNRVSKPTKVLVKTEEEGLVELEES